LLGLDRQQGKDEGVISELPPDTYLGKLMRQLFKPKICSSLVNCCRVDISSTSYEKVKIIDDRIYGKVTKSRRYHDKGEESFLTDDELAIILDFEEEQFRLGNFEKIFPCINNTQYYG